MAGVLSATQVLFTLECFFFLFWKAPMTKTPGHKSALIEVSMATATSPLTLFPPNLSLSPLLHSSPSLPPVRCHCRALSKYVLFIFLVAFQYLAAWQRGIKMCVSAKCQRVKGVELRAAHTVKHLLQRRTAGGSFISVWSGMGKATSSTSTSAPHTHFFPHTQTSSSNLAPFNRWW